MQGDCFCGCNARAVDAVLSSAFFNGSSLLLGPLCMTAANAWLGTLWSFVFGDGGRRLPSARSHVVAQVQMPGVMLTCSPTEVYSHDT